MLELKQIIKDYPAGNTTVHALKGVDLRFRTSEFVSILGPSGCGKTTLLNIIGGLDQYSSGDLIIDGVSTKDYKDRDWDTYRNHSIGFVFQTYNLIPHQTVLSNVELALTLAGVSKAERRERAAEALKRVGLGDQLNKRPNQMSGGQMQRVAIARALVNNPDIILADEPTGALDTETGLQVMELLKEVAEHRLVIMVTHNPELAQQYSSRIIRILDGVIVDDSAPLSEKEYQAEKTAELTKQQEEFSEVVADSESTADVAQEGKETKSAPRLTKTDKKSKKSKKGKKKSSMSLWTAFKLSLTNLFTKKGRTFLTSFAGSIGIIGIALILSVSQGMTQYINLVQEQTLSTYPLTIQSTAMDLSSIVASMMSDDTNKDNRDPDTVYQRDVVDRIAKLIDATAHTKNDLNAFKEFLESEMANVNSKLHSAIAGLQYQYDLDLLVYTKKPTGEIQKADPGELVRQVIMQILGSDAQSSLGAYYSSMTNFKMDIWQEILPGKDGSTINSLLYDQYDKVYGEWPKSYDEVVLVMNEDNEISDIALYTLGLIGDDYVDKIVNAFTGDGTENDDYEEKSWTYDKIVGTEVVIILNSSVYQQNETTGEWEDWREDPLKLSALYADGLKLKITGIIRPNPDATAHMLNGTIGYTSGLVNYVVNQAKQSDVVKAQEKNPDTDILTGLPFETSKDNLTNSQKKTAFLKNLDEMDANGKLKTYAQTYYVNNAEFIEAGVNQMLEAASLDDLLGLIAQYVPGTDIEALRKMLPEDEQLAKAAIIVQAKPLILSGVKKKTIEEKMADVVKEYPDEAERVSYIESQLSNCTDEQYGKYYDEVTEFSASTLEDNLALMGSIDLDTPSAISIYASSFEAKDIIAEEIARYNSEHDEAQQITYTDFVALMMSAVTTIIDAITYVLIAFVSISLIVSSIMIGVITLISVQERTKEIGILRAIGASKRDVSSMFNAETVIIGFAAGLIGVVFTYLLCIPINLILHALTGIATLNAVLPPVAALILVAISMLLTLISGLIPSRSAAKKDPVVALRTE